MQNNKPILLAVCIILVLNFVLLGQVFKLKDQVENITHNNNNLQSNINMIANNVNNALSQFTREQSWITPVQVNQQKSQFAAKGGVAVFNWQVKDYQQGSEVFFHYREPESAEFKTIKAESKGAGLFEVSIPLEVTVEPFWDIQVSQRNSSGKMISPSAAMEKKGEQAISYYVSAKAKDVIKSTEVSAFDLGYIAKVKYEPIQGHVDINKNQYSVSLFEHYPGSNNYESVTAQFYAGSNLVSEKVLAVQNQQNGGKTYNITYDSGSQAVSRLVIRVKYANGLTVEKEVF